MKKSDYLEDIWCEELEQNIKSFLTPEKLKILRENSKTGSVLLGMEFRPDKIAAYYLGNEKMMWAISAANNFQDGIKDYYLGREILIPTRQAFIKLNNS